MYALHEVYDLLVDPKKFNIHRINRRILIGPKYVMFVELMRNESKKLMQKSDYAYMHVVVN